MKSEPESRIENGIDMKFGFDDLKSCPDQTEHWDGVRNYQARNFLRDEIKEGHQTFFYHSNCKEPGIIGVCTIVRSGYHDHTQFDKSDAHYDSSSKPDNPKWYMVDVKYKAPLDRFVPLSELKRLHQDHVAKGGPLKNMALFTRARLSVQPVSQEEWDFIIELSKTSV
ncbi:thymocyte nuclear protein 1-like isoform X2 [Littorina saxatilis]